MLKKQTYSLSHTHTQVYFISRGRLRPANKQFNTTKNDYELTLNEDSGIELVKTCLYVVDYVLKVFLLI